MSKTTITITHGNESVQTVKDMMQGTGPSETANKLVNYMAGLASGFKSASVQVDAAAVQAEATVTVTTPAADDTVVVNGLTFTAKAVPSGAVQFALGADDNATATNFAAKLNASTDAKIQGIVVAEASASGVAEQSSVTLVSDTSVFEELTVTCPAVASATQADYFVIYSPSGTSTALWLDIDAAGTPPTGAAYTAATNKIMVSVTGGQTDIQVAAAVQAAAATTIGYSAVDNLDGTVTYTQSLVGDVTAPSTHNAGDLGAGSFLVVEDVLGVDSNLLNKYFTFKSANDVVSYYVWFNVNSEGVDPAPAGTGVPVVVAAGALASAIATSVKNAVDALASVSASVVGAVVTISNDKLGVSVNAGPGTSGLVVSTLVQGFDPFVVIRAYKPGVAGNVISLSSTGGFVSSGSVLSGGTEGQSVIYRF